MELDEKALRFSYLCGNQECFNDLANYYSRLINHNIDLFKKNYYFFGYEDQEIFNEALKLLDTCIHKFDDTLNIKFQTFYTSSLQYRLFNILRDSLSAKNKPLATAISFDAKIGESENTLYSIIPDGSLLVSEQFNNQELFKEIVDIYKIKLTIIEQKIWYYHLVGYTYEEIAHKFKINRKKVDNTIQKTRKLARNSSY